MKAHTYIPFLSICSALALIAGCGKSEPVPPTAEMPKPAESQAGTTVEAAKQAVTTAAEQVTNKAQDLIKQAQSLVDAQKYTDASSLLQQLASLKLTPEQQKLVDALKKTIQDALAKQATAEGTKAVGDLLKGKK